MLHYDQTRPRERMETRSYAVTIQRVLVLQALRYIFHSETLREHSVFRISRISRGKRPHARRPLVRRTPVSRFNMHLVDTFLRVGGITSTKCGLVHIKPTYRCQASPRIITDTTAFLNTGLFYSYTSLTSLIPVVCFCSQMIKLRFKFMTNHV